DEGEAVGWIGKGEDGFSAGALGAEDDVGEVTGQGCVVGNQDDLVAVLAGSGCPDIAKLAAPVGPFPKDRHAPRPLLGGNACLQELINLDRKVGRLREGRKEKLEPTLVDGVECEPHTAVRDLILVRDRGGGGVQIAAGPAEVSDDALSRERL